MRYYGISKLLLKCYYLAVMVNYDDNNNNGDVVFGST